MAQPAQKPAPTRTPVPTTSDIYPSLCYDDAPAAIDWLCRAFGFTAQLVIPGPDGTVAHSELSFGNGVIMVGSPHRERAYVGPRGLSGASQALCVRVDDPDAHCARAQAAGAVITRPVQDEEYGARGYMAKDLEGHQWYFGNYRPGAYWGAPSPAEPHR
jgi:uncharacterized glyoxalase superfamily protein PhnB